MKLPHDSIYQAHLAEWTTDAPKLQALRTILDQLGQDIYGRPEKLLMFTSSPTVSLIVALVWLFRNYCLSLIGIVTVHQRQDLAVAVLGSEPSRRLP